MSHRHRQALRITSLIALLCSGPILIARYFHEADRQQLNVPLGYLDQFALRLADGGFVTKEDLHQRVSLFVIQRGLCDSQPCPWFSTNLEIIHSWVKHQVTEQVGPQGDFLLFALTDDDVDLPDGWQAINGRDMDPEILDRMIEGSQTPQALLVDSGALLRGRWPITEDFRLASHRPLVMRLVMDLGIREYVKKHALGKS